MSVVPGVERIPVSHILTSSPAEERARIDGKFLRVDGQRFLVRGVTYGTFAPGPGGHQFPPLARVRSDFAAMAAAGVNTVRVYTPPTVGVLDAAAAAGLRVMVGIPWTQHVAFLDDVALARSIRREVTESVRRLARHPAVILLALGNEIPPAIVRWHGPERVERFLRELCDAARQAAPESLFTYVNFPPTEFLDLTPFDLYAVNVYLHREPDLRAYLSRLHHVAGAKPLLLAEAGADSIREGEEGQARITAMHARAALEEGLCGAVAFAWTDEWWRGGGTVHGWAFGLVDAARRPKPALGALSRAFADAPFADAERGSWPRVSVVVCACNAAGTIDDCLSSLGRLTYPDVEIIVVDDGSSDGTGGLARRYPFARVLEIPNGGLSAARNVGLHAATGEIVAYTDADVRVDADWLTYLVQPLLTTNVVGSGGPNVVPEDDPWIAQCVGRAPGAPTHVMLDDRVAEHVPGCNMAFRREALLAIGGFDPIYVRAGDDVDVCWRLQARGGRIGFAPAAWVWHHHRASIGAYWRQQVGYGEGEAWLQHRHPDKFAAGSMIWQGRIYSSLPFVRRLTRRRVNTGVWGLASFPSVYHSGADPLASLPHTPQWVALSMVLLAVGAVAHAATSHAGAAWLALAAGALGLGATMVRCLSCARRSDLRSLVRGSGRSAALDRIALRATIAWLHVLQPFARLRGRIKGRLTPPSTPAVQAEVTRAAARPIPGPRDAWTALRLAWGATAERRFWSERWIAVDTVLRQVLDALRISRLTPCIEIDDGWRHGRDLSVALGRWAWIDVSALVEEHAQGRVLVRARTSLRPTAFTATAVLAAVVAMVAAASGVVSGRWPLASVSMLGLGVGMLLAGLWRSAAAVAGVHAVIGHALRSLGALPVAGPRPRIVPVFGVPAAARLARVALPTFVVAGLAGVGGMFLQEAAGTTSAWLATARQAAPVEPDDPERHVPRLGMAVAPNGDLYLADGSGDAIRRVSLRGVVTTVGEPPAGPGSAPRRPAVRFDAPAGVAVAANGDLYVADSLSHRVYRVDRLTGATMAVAGDGRAAFHGDGGPAEHGSLHAPSALAIDRQGMLYIADSGNDRIRTVDLRTGRIATAVGGGGAERRAAADAAGDGGPAAAAVLARPSDIVIASNGDLYIADTDHHRVRRVDARTRIISTVAGTGEEGDEGDGGPAAQARLAGPTGLALVVTQQRTALYIADVSNGRIRVVGPDGRISSLDIHPAPVLGKPARLAYDPRGWLYVAGSRDRIAAVSLHDAGGRHRTVPFTRRVM
jgi:O-antigen biosynthesis protein